MKFGQHVLKGRFGTGAQAVILSVSPLGDKCRIHDKIDQKACILSHIGLKCRPGLQ